VKPLAGTLHPGGMPSPSVQHGRSEYEELTPHEIRRVAVEAGADPRTVAKYLAGARVASTCADRIRRTLSAFGYRGVGMQGGK
jgi:hypothetical protein